MYFCLVVIKNVYIRCGFVFVLKGFFLINNIYMRCEKDLVDGIKKLVYSK